MTTRSESGSTMESYLHTKQLVGSLTFMRVVSQGRLTIRNPQCVHLKIGISNAVNLILRKRKCPYIFKIKRSHALSIFLIALEMRK